MDVEKNKMPTCKLQNARSRIPEKEKKFSGGRSPSSLELVSMSKIILQPLLMHSYYFYN